MSAGKEFRASGRKTFLQKRIIALEEELKTAKKKDIKRITKELEDSKIRDAENEKTGDLTMGDIEELIAEFGSIENRTEEENNILEQLEDMQVKYCKDVMQGLKYTRHYSKEKDFDIKRGKVS